jgi:hypothetical protein
MSRLHDRARVVIAVSLLTAAARGLADKAALVDFVDKSCPFSRHDFHAQRVWVDEVREKVREYLARPPVVKRCALV